MYNIPSIDILKESSKVKSTEFIDNHSKPEKIKIINSIILSDNIGRGMRSIDLILEKKTNRKPLNLNGRYKVSSFNNTSYCLTNLRSKGLVLTDSYRGELEQQFNSYYENKSQNLSDELKSRPNVKKEMLSFLILKSNYINGELENPIEILIQDKELHEKGFGDAYTYYITKAEINLI